jgi:DNA-binding HxlR family transcriptional regulator
MTWETAGDTVCPIARSLTVIGDRWTMLIIRELFLATRRFEEFEIQTGISPNLLSVRLKRLETDGVIARRKYQDAPRRYEYRLTDKGLDLYPVLLSLKSWGERWGGFRSHQKPALEIIHRSCGHSTRLELVCPECREPFGARDVRVQIGKQFSNEREARQVAFRQRASAKRS